MLVHTSYYQLYGIGIIITFVETNIIDVPVITICSRLIDTSTLLDTD